MLTSLGFLALLTNAHADDNAQPNSTPVTIDADGTSPVISVVEGRGTATSSSGITASSVFTRDLCIAPCNLNMEPGLYEIFIDDSNTGLYAKPYQFQVGSEPISLGVVPGNRTMANLARPLWYGGLVVIGGGALLYALQSNALSEQNNALPAAMIVGGVIAVPVGLVFQKKGRGEWTRN